MERSFTYFSGYEGKFFPTMKPAYRWIVYPTPFDVTKNGKASAPSHKGGGENNYRSFRSSLSQKACRVQGQRPWSPTAVGETPCAILLARGERGEKKRQLFRGEADKTASPCFSDEICIPSKCSGGTFSTKKADAVIMYAGWQDLFWLV